MFLQILILQALTKLAESSTRTDLLTQHLTFFIQILFICQRYALNQCAYLKFTTKKLVLQNKKYFQKQPAKSGL